MLTLPIVSIVAFIAVWDKDQELNTVARLARETLVLVPLGLPLFIPLAFSEGCNSHSSHASTLQRKELERVLASQQGDLPW